MATDKPPTPRIPFFNGWMIFSTVVVITCLISAVFNLEPTSKQSNALPASNWWYYVGLVVFVFGVRLAQVIQLLRRNTPKWEWPLVEPWSEPLRTLSGVPLGIYMWYRVRSGEKDLEAFNNPARRHQIESEYKQYLLDFEAAYGDRR